jgi:hypothetical protein
MFDWIENGGNQQPKLSHQAPHRCDHHTRQSDNQKDNSDQRQPFPFPRKDTTGDDHHHTRNKEFIPQAPAPFKPDGRRLISRRLGVGRLERPGEILGRNRSAAARAKFDLPVREIRCAIRTVGHAYIVSKTQANNIIPSHPGHTFLKNEVATELAMEYPSGRKEHSWLSRLLRTS